MGCVNNVKLTLANSLHRLPSMNDVEKKRRILNYTTQMRKQYLKLLVLVKWAENAKDIQMCQVSVDRHTLFTLYSAYLSTCFL